MYDLLTSGSFRLNVLRAAAGIYRDRYPMDRFEVIPSHIDTATGVTYGYIQAADQVVIEAIALIYNGEFAKIASVDSMDDISEDAPGFCSFCEAESIFVVPASKSDSGQAIRLCGSCTAAFRSGQANASVNLLEDIK